MMYLHSRLISTLTAAVLLLQSTIVVPSVCACSAEAETSHASCCLLENVSSDCCETPRSCCASGSCDCDESISLSDCRCGCGEPLEHAPFTPAEKSEQSSNAVEMPLSSIHVATNVATPCCNGSDAVASIPYARSGPHAMQVLLCIWRT